MTAPWKRPAWAGGGAAVLAAARTGIGAVALVSPEVVGRPWVGEAAHLTEGRLLARALGGRDLVLGLGALAALRGTSAGGRGAGLWVGMGATADFIDALATLGAWGGLPAAGRWLVAMSAGGAAVAGGAAAWALIVGTADRPA